MSASTARERKIIQHIFYIENKLLFLTSYVFPFISPKPAQPSPHNPLLTERLTKCCRSANLAVSPTRLPPSSVSNCPPLMLIKL